MRTKKSIINIVIGIILQLIVILSGFLVKNVFIAVYGSNINGLVSAVDQIISSLAIVEGGIGGAAIAMLYKPLQENDNRKIEEILVSSKSFFMKSGYLYILLVGLIVSFYPYLIVNQVSISEVRALIIILAVGGIIEFFFFAKYKVLLVADQKLYILNGIQGIFTIINAIVVLYLMQNGYHYLLVRLIGAIVIVLRFILIYYYFKKEYPNISLRSDVKGIKLPQRWGVMLHQFSSLILYNTDLFLITIFMGNNSLVDVSIYGVYNLVAISIINIVSSITSGVQASMGNLLVSSDEKKVKEVYQKFEFITLFIISIIYISFSVLLSPFIKLYSENFNDANYNDLGLVVLFTIMVVLQGVRIPAVTVVAAAGHYKETQYRAVVEASINIIFSIILVSYYGLYGILLGTILAYIYRNTDLILYVNKYLIRGTLRQSIIRIFVYITIIFISSVILGYMVRCAEIVSYLEWFVLACIVGIISILIVMLISYLLDKEILNDIKKIFIKR